MPVREFLDITTESAYKTPTATPVLNTDRIAIRLTGDNLFTMRQDPQSIAIGHGGGLAVDSEDLSDTDEFKGSLNVPELTYTHALILMGLGLMPIVGGTSPWITSEPIGGLASVYIRHGVYQDDTGTYKRTGYQGVKGLGGKLSCSRASKKASLQLDLQAAAVDAVDPDGTAFPLPGDTDLPTDFVKFSHSTLTLGGSSELEYDSLEFSWANTMDPLWFASRTLTKLRYLGRSASLAANLIYKSSPDYRTAMNSLTKKAAIFAFDGGPLSFSVDMQGANRVQSVQDNLGQKGVYRQMVTLASRYSTATGKDFVFAMGT